MRTRCNPGLPRLPPRSRDDPGGIGVGNYEGSSGEGGSSLPVQRGKGLKGEVRGWGEEKAGGEPGKAGNELVLSNGL
ncbi:hypothetical protein PHLGIDRAFT_173119 [Phlebiopsis gigantea 11061_1 CR5-6]|uniref:Uncharacterized protein n=1 Tax=Phlebiopsis gigantea (strain 11061_1 CR5-6) TaxID=745531 RepID=A0A0C3S523_PHLG1|nr:hypothetical protein PHLGIDRAFT_173119 [Phlebiopsis gigantea 11061_1 CR5-6]